MPGLEGAPLASRSSFRRSAQSTSLRSGMVWVGLLAVTKVALMLPTWAKDYGYFRDEFYFLDAARHLAPGYVDFPPLVAFAGAAVRALFGISLVSLHLLPAVCGALVIVLTGLMARELGAGAFGQALAALTVLLSPMLLATNSFFSMNPFDQLWWALLAYLVIRLLMQDRPRIWLAYGIVLGLGLLTKESILAWAVALAVGLALTGARRYLASRWFWLGSALALLMIFPFLWWQAANGWPTIQFWQGYHGELVQRSTIGFAIQQAFGMSPAAIPVIIAGLYFYLISGAGRPARSLGLAFVLLFIGFSLADIKAYFLAPAYPTLFAGGATTLEAATGGGHLRWIRPAYTGLLVAVGAFLLPISLPVLSPSTLARAYAPAMANPAIRVESSQGSRLPEWLAGRLGWEEMAAAVGAVHADLPPGQQRVACILAGDYGQAGALNLYGPTYGLPPVISGSNNYYLWGPGRCTGEVVVAVGLPRDQLELAFGAVAEAGRIVCANCMAGETDVQIFLCRQPREPLVRLWPEFRRFGM